MRGPRSSYLGPDLFISLVDADSAPLRDDLRQLGLDLLCTNRDLPISMPVGKKHTDFTIAVNAPVASVRCLVGPTTPRPCRGEGEYAWRFISHLGLNYLSLADTDRAHGAAALRELLRLYVPQNATMAARQLEGLLSVATRPIVRRIPGAGPVCAGRGLQVTLTMDDSAFGGSGRHPARRGARPVLRQIRLDQRVHRDGDAQPGPRRRHALAHAPGPARDPIAAVSLTAPRAGPRRGAARELPARPAPPPFVAALAAAPHAYEFYQVMRLLEALHPRPPALRPQHPSRRTT